MDAHLFLMLWITFIAIPFRALVLLSVLCTPMTRYLKSSTFLREVPAKALRGASSTTSNTKACIMFPGIGMKVIFSTFASFLVHISFAALTKARIASLVYYNNMITKYTNPHTLTSHDISDNQSTTGVLTSVLHVMYLLFSPLHLK